MIVTLQDMKEYLRLDEIDDDNLINGLLTAADEYIKAATGFTFSDPQKIPERAKLLIKLLVSHWYETRSPVIVGTSNKAVNDIPFTVQSLLNQLSFTYTEEAAAP